ncbi:MAG: hypothetical protein AVDCRST_MAG01-01-846 [uncultured Rubrobacteraceae bacterium]|uniref:Uncharacterized protein n=1 Tax=uncultured Rubrobacteraceae bacterium TaxID=349277 RepID=A0A6J4NXH3_9ACTN|nr:MAG: hypothetical protein AVDCRST_MAG01-01-846 [uncultured Rubrobacteraceae bacterium]
MRSIADRHALAGVVALLVLVILGAVWVGTGDKEAAGQDRQTADQITTASPPSAASPSAASPSAASPSAASPSAPAFDELDAALEEAKSPEASVVNSRQDEKTDGIGRGSGESGGERALKRALERG